MSPTRAMHALVLASHLGLTLGLIISGSKLSAIAGLLLFIPLPGLLRGHSYTHAWASMMVVIYCAVLLADGYARPQAKFGSFVLASLAGIEFIALMMYVRFNARELRVRKARSDAASR